MTIGERIRLVRKKSKLTQAEFGEKIGLKQSSLGQIESSTRNATDRTILLICEKFNVREVWLRTGEGEMFHESDDTLLEQLRIRYDLNDFGVRFMTAFLNLTAEQRDVMQGFAYAIIGAKAQTTSSEPTTEELEEAYKKMLLGFAPRKGSSASNITSNDSSSAMTSEG